ncbi:MAG: peptidylprolyl isomerase, partial [Burkholderiales bacterium]
MAGIVRIDDKLIGVDEFIKSLKLGGQFESLIEQLVRERLTVLAAKKHGVDVTAEEIQERADQFRRIQGLHRAADTNAYFDRLGVSLDDFETFVTDGIYQEKIMAEVCSDKAVEEYFQL